MKLDRGPNARGKYGLINHRMLAAYRENMPEPSVRAVEDALALLQANGIYDPADTPATEIFAIKLKDKYARSALRAYAHAARNDGEAEYGGDVDQMAGRAGVRHEHCKKPD